MKQIDPVMHRLARQLLTHGADETGESLDSASLADTAERVLEKLRLHLSKRLGEDGFQALLRRALTLARADFPWLEEIPTEGAAPPDGSLQGRLRVLAQGRDPAEAAGGFTAALTHLLGLLVAFIGEDLTIRLLQGAWPGVIPHTDPHLDPSGEGAGQEDTMR